MKPIARLAQSPALVLGALSFFLSAWLFWNADIVLDDSVFLQRYLPSLEGLYEHVALPESFRAWFGQLHRPLSLLSLSADLHFWGHHWSGMHLHQAFWYGLTVAAFVVFSREALALFAPQLLSQRLLWVLGLLFACHPTHIHTAAWIATRHDVIAGSLSLYAIALSLRAFRTHSTRTHFFAAVLYFLALQAKESAWMVFPLLLLVSFAIKRFKLSFAWPYLLASLFAFFLSWHGRQGYERSIPFHAEALQRWLASLAWSAQQFCFPSQSTLIPPEPSQSLLGFVVIALGVMWFLWAWRRFRRDGDFLPMFCLLFTAGTLAPSWMVSWKPLMASTVADRYLLLPVGGLLLLLLSRPTPRWISYWPWAAFSLWAFLAAPYLSTWSGPPLALAEHMVDANSSSLSVRVGAMARVKRVGLHEEALRLALLEPMPTPLPGEEDDYFAYRSAIAAAQKDWNLAREHAKESLRLSGGHPRRWHQLGNTCWAAFLDIAEANGGAAPTVWAEQARAAFMNAVQKNPRSYRSHLYLGRAQASFGDFAAARLSFESAIRWGRGSAEAQMAKGDLELLAQQ